VLFFFVVTMTVSCWCLTVYIYTVLSVICFTLTMYRTYRNSLVSNVLFV